MKGTPKFSSSNKPDTRNNKQGKFLKIVEEFYGFLYHLYLKNWN